MSDTYYTDRDNAIQREIIEALGENADDFDIEAIADDVLASDEHGYWCTVDPDEFWHVVQQHDKTAQ